MRTQPLYLPRKGLPQLWRILNIEREWESKKRMEVASKIIMHN